MPARRRRLLAAALVASGVVLTAVSAAGAARPPAAPAPPAVVPAASAPAATTPAPAATPAPVVALAPPPAPRSSRVAAARGPRAATRLGVTVVLPSHRGGLLAVKGLLQRTSGPRVAGGRVALYTRVADTGSWQRVSLQPATSRGTVTYWVRDLPDLQVTLRFAGDGRYRPAASATLVPRPTADGLAPRLVRALAAARTAARRAGYTLVVNSGYRTWARQQAMYDAAVRRYGSARAARLWVLPPAESTHVRGLALDLGSPAAAAWLAGRSARFGLCRPYAGEPWHFEYRPDWIAASDGRCPPPVTTPGDPDPLSPLPHVPVA